MKTSFYKIDAFPGKVFDGNPAVICILDTWVDTGNAKGELYL